MKKGIIFDLDGTLWEVTNITYKSVNEIIKKYNLNIKYKYMQFKKIWWKCL